MLNEIREVHNLFLLQFLTFISLLYVRLSSVLYHTKTSRKTPKTLPGSGTLDQGSKVFLCPFRGSNHSMRENPYHIKHYSINIIAILRGDIAHFFPQWTFKDKKSPRAWNMSGLGLMTHVLVQIFVTNTKY